MKRSYSATETFENPKIVDIKSVIIEDLKTPHKLSIRL